jgi:hypothetical protein
VLYWLMLKKFLFWLDHKKAKQEKHDIESRIYCDFGTENDYPRGKNVYFECLHCGNVIASLPGRAVSCKCRNVVIDDAGHPIIQNRNGVKVFIMK